MTEPQDIYTRELLQAVADHLGLRAHEPEPDDDDEPKPQSLHVPREGANPQIAGSGDKTRDWVNRVFGNDPYA